MATYLELTKELRVDPGYVDFQDRIAQAITQKCRNLVQPETPTNEELTFSAAAFADPRAWSEQVINYVVADAQAQMPSITVEQILAASDAEIQGYVDEAIDKVYAKLGAPS